MKQTLSSPPRYYDQLTPELRRLVDEQYEVLRRQMADAGYTEIPTDDRADIMLDALAWHLVQSSEFIQEKKDGEA